MARHLINGDDLARVDNIWRGFRGVTFAWRARYVAYGIFLGTLLFVLAVERRAGVLRPWPVFFAVLIGIGTARVVGEQIGFEVNFRAFIRAVWLDLTAPRGDTKPIESTLIPSRIVFKESAAHAQPEAEAARANRRIRRWASAHRRR